MKTYVISSEEELEAILSEIAEPQIRPKQEEVFYTTQDQKDLYAVALDTYAERYATVNSYFSEKFADMAKAERTGH